MKTLTKKFARKEKGSIRRSCLLLFIFLTSLTMNVLADDGPSLKNVKKNSQVIKTEQAAIDKERQEQLAFQEKMSYLYMFLGLAFVIGVAWFSTVYVRKNKKVAVLSNTHTNGNTNHHRHYIKHPHDPRRRPKVSRARR